MVIEFVFLDGRIKLSTLIICPFLVFVLPTALLFCDCNDETLGIYCLIMVSLIKLARNV